MMCGKMTVLLALMVLLYTACEVDAVCQYEADTQACLDTLKRERQNQEPTITLDYVMDIFEKGVDNTCKQLETFMTCIKGVTCEALANSQNKPKVEGILTGRIYMCDKNKQAFIANTDCMKKRKNEIKDCQNKFGNAPTCDILKAAADCIDKDLKTNCKDFADVFSHTSRKYLEGMNKGSVGKDCHLITSKASLTGSMSIATLLAFLMAAMLAMKP